MRRQVLNFAPSSSRRAMALQALMDTARQVDIQWRGLVAFPNSEHLECKKRPGPNKGELAVITGSKTGS